MSIDFEQLLKELVLDLSEKVEPDKKLLVGKVAPDTYKIHREYVEEKRYLEKEMELELKRMELEFNHSMKNLFRDRQEDLQELKRTFWNKVYSELNLDKSERYQATANGEIYRVIKDIETRH